MTSKRQERLSSLIQEELGDIFLKEGKATFGNSFITVSKVHVSGDLGHVKVYLSIMNEKKPEQLLKNIQHHTKELKMALASRIKNQVKKIPEVEFFYDDTLDYVDRMERLFNENRKNDPDLPNEE